MTMGRYQARCRRMVVIVFSALIAVGCAHHGVVESLQTESDLTEAQINIGSASLKEGVKLNVYRRVCGMRARLGSSSVPHCRNVKVGEARVSKLLDENRAAVKPEGELKLEASMIVRRK